MDESAQPSRRALRILLTAAGALVLGGILLRVTAPEPEPVEAAGSAAAALEVGSLKVTRVLRPDRTVVSGVLEARRSVRIASETSGRVLEIGAEALDRVEEEQVLVRVDPLRARVALDRAEAAVTRATSELALAKASLDRQQSLKERDVASESAFDDASNRQRVAEAAIRDARAQRDQARDELAKKTIRAPFAGVLRTFSAERGEVVSVGQELGELLDLETARVTIGLSDRQIVSLVPGAAVAVEVEAYPNESFRGRILRVGAAADRGSRKFPAEIEIDNADRRLLPGMVARVELELPAKAPRLLLPREALVREFGLGFVYVIEEGEDGASVARRRRVSARDLPFEPTVVEVDAGLEDGERVAVSGVRALRDGARVRTREATAGRLSAGGRVDGDAS